MPEFVVKGGKALRLGYTTGSCATAAAAAAARMLLTQKAVEQSLIVLPGGREVVFSLEDVEFSSETASCSVIKDAGDDPDATDGMKIFAACSALPRGFELAGGEGVGVVTAGGLAVPQGEAAINPVPRKMILANLEKICAELGYQGGLRVVVSAPGGEDVARKTFNPRLGISGGISILGTTGIVEPMSRRAIVDTVKLLIDKQQLVDPENILITPGNYGRDFIGAGLGLDSGRAVKFSNFLGECLDYLVYKEFKNILLVGHLGKLVKVAGGVMDTHSAVADCRMEIFTAHAACAGASRATAQAVLDSKTAEEAVAVLRGAGLEGAVFAGLLEKIMFHLRYRLKDGPRIEVIVFSEGETVMTSAGAGTLARKFTGESA